MAKVIEADNWLSEQDARDLIFYFIRWGEHPERNLRDMPEDLIEIILRQRGYDFDAQVAALQKNPHRAIKGFENLFVGGTWNLEVSPGGVVQHSFIVDGVEVSRKTVTDHAVLRMAHKSDFLAACRARDEAIRENSFDSFYTAVAKGFSSIEAYFALRAHVHNENCTEPSQRLIEKRKGGGFVSLDEKIIDWLPVMTGASVNIENCSGWEDYKFLRKIRNDVVIHPKPGAGLATLEELADGINRFRYGIGSLMFLLHQAFGETMQSVIIRAMRYPTVRVVQKTDF